MLCNSETIMVVCLGAWICFNFIFMFEFFGLARIEILANNFHSAIVILLLTLPTAKETFWIWLPNHNNKKKLLNKHVGK